MERVFNRNKKLRSGADRKFISHLIDFHQAMIGLLQVALRIRQGSDACYQGGPEKPKHLPNCENCLISRGQGVVAIKNEH